MLSKDVKNVLFAGAFDNAVKDPELAFAAVALLQTQCSGAEAPVYSVQCKGEETSEAITSAQTPNTSIKLIELKGYNRDQVNALMYNCDALLMTSRTEGSPQVIKEAMACGCPIVSVDVGDVAERVSGVEGCYIVRAREPKDIAEALQRALAFEGKTNGRERILEMGLSNDQVAEQLIEIYKQLLV
jgi:glycosyltransferase involved in cell wall biosynthesis